ncbi:hypothetical protein PIB30_047122 [Stylosanthes scabra]|uniref:Uncharacterized protein n=1 Tax=Stylosanthes scabra TaxID=79078 RepID=A0ABU6TGG7_9FABA|nr:hypothetical protein [Stylosanthes scabra]
MKEVDSMVPVMEEAETSRVEATQSLRALEGRELDGGSHMNFELEPILDGPQTNHTANGPAKDKEQDMDTPALNGVASPTITQSLQDDRRTEDVIVERRIAARLEDHKRDGENAWVGPKINSTANQSKREATIPESDSSSLSAPPGFEMFLRENEKKEEARVIRKVVRTRNAPYMWRSNRRASTKLKEYVVEKARRTSKKRAKKGKGNRNKGKNNIDNLAGLNGEEDEIEDWEDDIDETWQVAYKSGVAAESEQSTKKYLLEMAATSKDNCAEGSTKKTRCRKRNCNFEETKAKEFKEFEVKLIGDNIAFDWSGCQRSTAAVV